MYWQVFSESVRRSDRPARLIHNGNRWKLDRLSRSLRDGIDTLCDWLDKGVRLVSVTQQLDFAFPAGKMIASVLFAVAEMEQQTRRERQAAGIAVAKRNGVYQGRKAGSLKADAARALALRSKGLNDTEIATALGVAREPCNATCTHRQGRADLAGRGRGRVIWADTLRRGKVCAAGWLYRLAKPRSLTRHRVTRNPFQFQIAYATTRHRSITRRATISSSTCAFGTPDSLAFCHVFHVSSR